MYKAKKETKRWLKALDIAKAVFEQEGYHTEYLKQIEHFIRSKKMYNPRISKELIPRLYELAKVRKVPMTRLVNKIITDYLERQEVKAPVVVHDNKKQWRE